MKNVRPACPQCQSVNTIKKGFYRRACDSKYAQKYRCLCCHKYFSSQSFKDTYRHKKVRIISSVLYFLTAGVSRRHIARVLGVHRETVERKLRLLSMRAQTQHNKFISQLGYEEELQFDEMETYEHTKCKPVSIPLVVTKRRFILAIGVASQPAKGRLAKISQKKYGPRIDERPLVISNMFAALAARLQAPRFFFTDKNTAYPKYLKQYFPKAGHKTTQGGRSCIAGYGELKKKGWDPIFSLNHTAAMLRDHLATLKRRTWTSTKRLDNLLHLLVIYTVYHNRVLAKIHPEVWQKARKIKACSTQKRVIHPLLLS